MRHVTVANAISAMLHASHTIGVLLLKQSRTVYAACHSSAASRP